MGLAHDVVDGFCAVAGRWQQHDQRRSKIGSDARPVRGSERDVGQHASDGTQLRSCGRERERAGGRGRARMSEDERHHGAERADDYEKYRDDHTWGGA